MRSETSFSDVVFDISKTDAECLAFFLLTAVDDWVF